MLKKNEEEKKKDNIASFMIKMYSCIWFPLIFLMNSSKTAHQSIFNPDWDFTKLGIGGLDEEFSGIFRRAFASRVFPPEVIEQLGKWNIDRIFVLESPVVWMLNHKTYGCEKVE